MAIKKFGCSGLFGAHHAGYFCSIWIWWTPYPSTGGLHKVQEGCYSVCCTSINWLWVNIDTNRHSASVCSMVTFSHVVTVVLSCPRVWAGYSPRYDDLGAARWCVAYRTGSFVPEYVGECRTTVVSFILCPIQSCTICLLSRCCFKELWFVVETQKFCSSCLLMMTPHCCSLVHQLRSLSSGTCGPPPSCVGHTTTRGTYWTRRTCCTNKSISILNMEYCLHLPSAPVSPLGPCGPVCPPAILLLMTSCSHLEALVSW